jgi:hypothetical protein
VISEDGLQLDSEVSFENRLRTQTQIWPCQCFIDREALIDEALRSLVSLQAYVAEFPPVSGAIDELVSFLKDMKDPLDPSDTILRSKRLKPLRDMLFWFPSRYLPNLNAHPSVMLLMAHMHAIALFIEPVTDDDSAHFRSVNAAPIQAFYEEFSMRAGIETQNGEGERRYNNALALMEFPLRAVAYFHCLLNNHCGQSFGNLDSIWGTLRRRSSMSILQILEGFPVGLWHNSLS